MVRPKADTIERLVHFADGLRQQRHQCRWLHRGMNKTVRSRLPHRLELSRLVSQHGGDQHHTDAHTRRVGFDLLTDLSSVSITQVHVEQNHVGPDSTGNLASLFARLFVCDREARSTQDSITGVAIEVPVIDVQDQRLARRGRCSGRAGTGAVTLLALKLGFELRSDHAPRLGVPTGRVFRGNVISAGDVTVTGPIQVRHC